MAYRLGSVLIPVPQIRNRVEELAAAISADYAGADLVLICVLKGAAIFWADLCRAMTIPCQSDFVAMASRSPIVPKNRERLFGKALFAGYEKDFVAALHLLVPQIEHMVRWHLKAAGIKTTNLDKDGIENENGLSALMELPEVTQIFGEDLSFELKALVCDAFGPNLRNELAHGLLDDEACHSAYAIYAWWLGLKLVFNTFWNAKRKADVEKGADDKS